MLRSISEEPEQPNDPQSSGLPWCVCAEPEQPNDPQSSGLPWCVCAKCRLMPQQQRIYVANGFPALQQQRHFRLIYLMQIYYQLLLSAVLMYMPMTQNIYQQVTIKPVIDSRSCGNMVFGSEQSACSAVLCGEGCQGEISSPRWNILGV